MLKRILLFIGISLLSVSLAPAASWLIQPSISAGYVAQQDNTIDAETVYNPVVLTEIELFRIPSPGSIGFGFSLGFAGIVDDIESTPRIVPCGTFRVGSPDLHFFGGACADGQNGGSNSAVEVFGLSKEY